MCNCGKKREHYGESQSSRPNTYKNVEPLTTTRDEVYFEYTGLSALSVTGKISGRQYRFGQPGNIQGIDHRDAPGMMGVPVLRKVNRQYN